MSTNEITPGYVIPPFVVDSVDREHIRQIALVLDDPNPIHFDLDAVATAGMGDREINQGGSTMAYIIDMITAWACTRSALQRIKCRFRDNVRAGDTVTAGGTVLEVTGGGATRQALCDVWVDRHDGARVIDGTVVVALPEC
jgi:acyl dehydratase